MGIPYTGLFVELAKRNMKKKDLLNIMHSPQIARFSKNEPVNTDTIEKICEYLDCQPGDLMSYTKDPVIAEKNRAFMEKRAAREAAKMDNPEDE